MLNVACDCSQSCAPTICRETIPAYYSVALQNTRAVDVLLPPGYHSQPTRHFPVLYLNDGQDIDALGLPATLARLVVTGRIQPIIVVGIAATVDRLHEYGTVGVPNAQGLGERAGRYSQFLRHELMPEMNRRYRVRSGSQHTAIVGASMGGLTAFDLAWSHPDLFGAVGVFSGSFWWRADDRSVRARVVSRIMHRKVRSAPTLPAIRMWFQTGTEDETSDRDGDGVIDSIQDTWELITALEERGFRLGKQMRYREIAGGRHDQATWSQVMPELLEWLWPTER
ncbi:MAG TPA: alpha/beta hydrolase-fold protein [Roseiflexaceae bacterium]|nr:alpha/beta hydrolase-fold protein [Roseiflexaceae bacterium]